MKFTAGAPIPLPLFDWRADHAMLDRHAHRFIGAGDIRGLPGAASIWLREAIPGRN
jgi:hypothetical protein